jgi:hypothetical protein
VVCINAQHHKVGPKTGVMYSFGYAVGASFNITISDTFAGFDSDVTLLAVLTNLVLGVDVLSPPPLCTPFVIAATALPLLQHASAVTSQLGLTPYTSPVATGHECSVSHYVFAYTFGTQLRRGCAYIEKLRDRGAVPPTTCAAELLWDVQLGGACAPTWTC